MSTILARKNASVPAQVRRTGKVTDFLDDIREGTESNVFAAPADSNIKERGWEGRVLGRLFIEILKCQSSATAI